MAFSLSVWTMACRPKTLIISISPVFIGTVLAFNTMTIAWPLFLCTLLTSIGIQIGTNFANDLFDFLKGADTKQRRGPTRVTQAGLVSVSTMKRATACVFALTIGFGSVLIWQGGVVIACLLTLAICLGIFYTAGPFPLAYLGLGDLFTFIFFGPVATASTYYLQTHAFSLDACIAGIAPGAFSAAILVINNLRDVEQDLLANKKTLPVRFGITYGKIQYISMLLLSGFTALYFGIAHPFCLLALLFFLPAIPVIRSLFQPYEKIAWLTLLPKSTALLWIYTVLFCCGFF